MIEYVDMFILADKKFETKCLWFGFALSEFYNDVPSLVDRSLEILSKRKQDENTSYEFLRGLYAYYHRVNGEETYKQLRNELLTNPQFVELAVKISNNATNTYGDIIKIKDALTFHSLTLSQLTNIWSMNLTDDQYLSIANEIVEYNGGVYTSLHYLNIVNDRNKECDLTNNLISIVANYSEWSEDRDFIELITGNLNKHKNVMFAEILIKSIIERSDTRRFNQNYSITDLVKVLIEDYQELFLHNIEPLLIDKDFNNYFKLRRLEDVLVFKNNASAEIYVKWCRKIGRNAAEFVANFISLFEEMGDGLIWNSNVLALMREYGEGTYVLNNISTRLYNGMVKVSRYSFNKDMYKKLLEDENVCVHTWAIEQYELMEEAIKKELERSKLHQIYHK